jgi:hypothetical protein
MVEKFPPISSIIERRGRRMNDSILATLQQHLGPDTIQQMSSAIGADPATTSSAISRALPALLGGLKGNVANPEGAASLDRALDAHDGSILGNLGGLLGGDGPGGAILGHIFGTRRAPVEEGVSRSSGLDAAQVARLMAMLAPIVMGVLGRMKREKGLDANRLPDVLQQGAGDGDFGLDDLVRMGGGVLGGMFGKK